jgi:hypothetical protein
MLRLSFGRMTYAPRGFFIHSTVDSLNRWSANKPTHGFKEKGRL